MWVSIDAAYLGSTWISEKYSPKKELMKKVDSIAINFLKLLMLSPGGSVFFVADKLEYIEAMGGKSDFSFYKNEYSNNFDVIDYKDWSIGLVRRNYALHFFYLFSYFGVAKLREAIDELHRRTEYLEELLLGRADLFEIRYKSYSLISFRIVSKEANYLTHQLGLAVKNIDEGFCSPSSFQDEEVIRVVIGNFHTTNEHILTYFNKIVAEAEQLVANSHQTL
jgi:glutamate/tyrosine decarboxylase-like PLP-dependent enzyme